MSAPLVRWPRGGWPFQVILAWYILAAALLPFGHHDIVCHLKSSTHCTTCVAGSAVDLAGDTSALSRVVFSDTGRAIWESGRRIASLPLPAASGRAPPASIDHSVF